MDGRTRTDPDGPGRGGRVTDPDGPGRTDGRTDGRTHQPTKLHYKDKVHPVDDCLGSSDANLVVYNNSVFSFLHYLFHHCGLIFRRFETKGLRPLDPLGSDSAAPGLALIGQTKCHHQAPDALCFTQRADAPRPDITRRQIPQNWQFGPQGSSRRMAVRAGHCPPRPFLLCGVLPFRTFCTPPQTEPHLFAEAVTADNRTGVWRYVLTQVQSGCGGSQRRLS